MTSENDVITIYLVLFAIKKMKTFAYLIGI